MTPAAFDAVTGVVRTRLDNGLSLLVAERPDVPLVSVWSWYRVGSGDESPGQTGVSHWVEHMTFKGTELIPPAAMRGYVDRFGGMWNGYTWLDQTAYVSTATRDVLDELLVLEAERMDGCLFDAGECESERTVILAELHGAENDPEQVLETEVVAAALKAHPYRHPTIGWESDLRTMTRADLVSHYRRHYGPANATLVVAGAVHAPDVLRRVADRFDGRGKGRQTIAPLRPVDEPPPPGARLVVIERPGSSHFVKCVCPAPAVTAHDFPAMLAADAVLSGASGLNIWAAAGPLPPQRQSRLYRALVEPGLAASASSVVSPTSRPFLWTASVAVAEGVSLESVTDALHQALEAFVRDGPSEEELARARRQIRARMVYDVDSVTNVGHQLGFFETIASLDRLGEIERAVERLTPADVHACVARRLARPCRTTGWFRAISG